jgi:hypothetical protein
VQIDMLPLLEKVLLFWTVKLPGQPPEKFRHWKKPLCIQRRASVHDRYARKNLLQLLPKRQAQ